MFTRQMCLVNIQIAKNQLKLNTVHKLYKFKK